MKIGELDEFLELEEPACGYLLWVQDEEHRELLEESYIHVLITCIHNYTGLSGEEIENLISERLLRSLLFRWHYN